MSTNTNVLPRNRSRMNIGVMVQIAMLSAIAAGLMFAEMPLGFAPPFLQIDLSEVPVMIGCFALGPVAGAIIELLKILLTFVIKGTVTAGVGEFANFLIGCALVVPAGMIYRSRKTKRAALAGMAIGTVFMTAIGCLLNAYLLFPVYAKAFGMPIESLIEMGTAVNKNINGLLTFIVLAVVPFNLLKGTVITVVTLLIYKKISPVLRKINL